MLSGLDGTRLAATATGTPGGLAWSYAGGLAITAHNHQHLIKLSLGRIAPGGTLVVTTCSSQTSFDTVLGLFTTAAGSNPARTSDLVLAAYSNDDSTCAVAARSSRVTLTGVRGSTHFISVAGVNAAYGTYSLTWRYSLPSVQLTSVLSGTSGMRTADLSTGIQSGFGGTARGVTFASGQQQHLLQLNLGAAASLGGSLMVTTCSVSTTFDTIIAVGRTTSGAAPSAANPLALLEAGNDNPACATGAAAASSSTVTVTNLQTRTPFLLVAGNAQAAGTYALRWAYTMPVSPTRTGTPTKSRVASPAASKTRTRKAKL